MENQTLRGQSRLALRTGKCCCCWDKGCGDGASGDLSVGEVEGFGRGNGLESESTEEGGVLEQGLLMMGREGSEDGGKGSRSRR
jgi:hypothetical protein